MVKATSKAVLVILFISTILVIVGALNWGWIGLTSNNVISSINNATFKSETAERVLYVLVGLAAIVVIVGSFMVKPEAYGYVKA